MTLATDCKNSCRQPAEVVDVYQCLAELEAKVARLKRKLRIAKELLALQKVSQLLGVALPSDETL